MFDFFKPAKKNLFLVDGDCCLTDTWVYEDILGSSEVYVIYVKDETSNFPRALTKYPEIIQVPLTGYRTSKETVDKYIAIVLQKAIQDGYSEINIVSKDFDMLDIADMAIAINSPSRLVTINIVMPNINNGIAKGSELQQKVSHNFERNIYLVKQKNTKH